MINHRVHDYRFLIQRWRALARLAGLRLRPLARAGEYPLFYLVSKSLEKIGGMYISAGIHGDEPASTEALLIWAEENASRLADLPVLLFPCLNPWGLINNRRHDEFGNDLNRSFHREDIPMIAAVRQIAFAHCFRLTLHLHEDYDAQGMYLYEVGRARPHWGEDLLAAASAHVAIDGRTWIDGRKAHEGIIRPKIALKKYEVLGYPEALWLRLHHTRRAITVEAPSEFALAERIAGLKAVIEECVARVAND